MISVKQNGEIYEVTFPYDPFVVDYVKKVPGRRWISTVKMWTIPKDKLGFLLAQFKGTQYESADKVQSEEQINQNATLDVTAVIPDIDISSIPFYVREGAKPYQHQLDFMKYSIYRQLKGNMNGFLLGDDQGLSKTMESANLAIYHQKQNRFQHCLVICCVNSSKYNWVKDIEDHTRGLYHPYILGSRLRKRRPGFEVGGSKEKYDDLVNLKMYGADKGGEDLPYFLILNVEAIRYKVGRKYLLAERLIELINQGYISMIIIDEVHKNLSPTSQQGKQLIKIKTKITGTPLWMPMSGTPITKKPLDLFLPLRLVNAHPFDSYYKWAMNYCLYGGFGGHEIIGYKNIPRLKEQLQANMLRRMKDDVLDLPPKIHYDEYVDNTPYQERLYQRTAMGLMKQQEEIVKSLNPLSKFLRLRQVNGNPELVEPACDIKDTDYINKNAKLRRLMELLEEIHERGEKVVIFSNWVESLRTLYRFVSKKYKTCCFTGTMKESERQRHKQVFIENPEYTVMVGTFGALGTTHTLTVARNEIMYDEPWNPSDKVQAEDRIYRIGTNQSVNIYTLITRDTVDDRVHEILYTKSGISQFIVDGKLDIMNNPKLFNLLLSDTLKSIARGEDENDYYS